MLRASYGRFSQGVLTGEFGAFHPGATPTTTTAFDPATGGYTRIVSVVDPRINLQLDPGHARAAHGRVLDWRGSRGRPPARGGDRLRPQGRRATSSDGRMSAVSIARRRGRCPTAAACRCSCSSTSPAARRFLLTNPDGYSLTYNGLVMAVEKRRSHGWQAFGSYTLSRASGLQASSGTTAAGAQVSTVAPAATR